MTSHELKLYHPGNFNQDLGWDIGEWWSLEHGLGRWVNGGRDHFWMFPCLSLLFFSSLDVGLVQMASARVFTTSQWMWSFPVRRIHRKVTIELYRSVVGLMGSYNCVRRMIVFILCFPFHSLSLIQFMQPRRSAPKERNNVKAARDPGRVTAILYSRLAMSLRSLAMILHKHLFTITRVHVRNHIPSITICFPTRPKAGVRALTIGYDIESVLWHRTGVAS